MGEAHQCWVAMPVQESMYAWPLTILDPIELLRRFSYVHTNSHECILAYGKIGHLVRL
jgi:hypothetical protein